MSSEGFLCSPFGGLQEVWTMFSMSFFLLLIAVSMSASSTLAFEFYISHFCNKAINGFCNSVRFIGDFIKFPWLPAKNQLPFQDLILPKSTIASILVGLKLLVKLVRSLVRFDILVNRILERSEIHIRDFAFLPIGIVSMLLVEHSVICHILAFARSAHAISHHSATMRP